jgi:cytidylate kinase
MTDAPHRAAGGVLPALALDGLSGVGKSSVGRAVALSWGWGCLDTGASYRAVTVAALAADVLPAGADAIPPAAVDRATRIAERALQTLRLPLDPRERTVLVDGVDVTTAIRGEAATATVSAVSAAPSMRRLLVAWQRAAVLEAVRTIGGCVCEGRDIGGVVLPDAAVKVWLTADADARAGRRAGEGRTGGTVTDVRRSVARRDALDSARAADPVRRAADAGDLDTTALTLSQVVGEVQSRLRAAGLMPGPAWA